MTARMNRVRWYAPLMLVLLIPLSGCDLLTQVFHGGSIEYFVPEVIAAYPHDTSAFTEGLVYDDGVLYESTGLYGHSELREVNIETGEVMRSVTMPETDFGEGIGLVGDQLWQWTWQEANGYIYDRSTFEVVGNFTFEGEGWGMCYDGEYLYTTDGSNRITQRNTVDFSPTGTVLYVYFRGQAVPQLNELECVGDYLYSNIWFSNAILRIDKSNGAISGVINATDLLTEAQRAQLDNGAVLNGIAYNPDRDTFYLTGKKWPFVFEVQLVNAAE
ncbi:MAG: glutaminyl-peptide cyclotransferase [Anaerolineae bacterium]